VDLQFELCIIFISLPVYLLWILYNCLNNLFSNFGVPYRRKVDVPPYWLANMVKTDQGNDVTKRWFSTFGEKCQVRDVTLGGKTRIHCRFSAYGRAWPVFLELSVRFDCLRLLPVWRAMENCGKKFRSSILAVFFGSLACHTGCTRRRKCHVGDVTAGDASVVSTTGFHIGHNLGRSTCSGDFLGNTYFQSVQSQDLSFRQFRWA